MSPPSPSHVTQERLTPPDFSLALLALASGSSDAISFLTLGKVFTSAMTGNTALLGIAVGQGRIADALMGFSALMGFAIGVATAAALSESRSVISLAHGLRPLFALEAAYLGCFALVWTLAPHPAKGGTVFALIILSAAAMGIQSVAARRINAPGISTIVFTSTLVSIITSITGAVVRRARPLVGFVTRRQIGIFVSYMIGATIAGFMLGHELIWIVFLPLVSLIGAFACCEFDAHQQSKKP